MNFTPTSTNYKIPQTANDPKPTFINHSTPGININMTNNRPLDPLVLQKIRELSSASDTVPIITNPITEKSPFQKKSGLLFRDILHRADNTRSCSSCGNKK